MPLSLSSFGDMFAPSRKVTFAGQPKNGKAAKVERLKLTAQGSKIKRMGGRKK